MLFCHKNQSSAMHLCGQYVLADRFLSNGGCLIECEVFYDFCLSISIQKKF